MDKTASLGMRLPEETARELEALAAKEGVSKSEYLLQIIEAHIRNAQEPELLRMLKLFSIGERAAESTLHAGEEVQSLIELFEALPKNLRAKHAAEVLSPTTKDSYLPNLVRAGKVLVKLIDKLDRTMSPYVPKKVGESNA